MRKLLFQICKIAVISCILVGMVSLICSNIPEDRVLRSLGKYDDYVFYTEGEFQDYTDYAKYYYRSVNVEGNPYFTRIQESDLNDIYAHLDDFEGWIEIYRGNDNSREIVKHYDFDRKTIDTDDYFYIDSEKRTWSDGDTSFVRYDVYILDTQTLVVYYFHNNR